MMRALTHRRHFVGWLALVLLLATFAVMAGASQTALLGAVAFAPWVSLIGVDVGVISGLLAGVGAGGLWIAAAELDSLHPSLQQSVIRVIILGALGGGSGIVGDRLRKSERARSVTVARQRALIDATLDGICLTDPDGHIMIVNEPLARIAIELGMPAEGTVPERLLAISKRLTDPETYERRMRELAVTPGEASTDEFEVRETGRVFRGFTAPVKDRAGRDLGRIWTLRDVTADKEIDRMRDAFVATVSHELRTPLTSISGFLEMLEEEKHGLEEAPRMYLDVIRRSSERLRQLVDDLLLVAQIEAQRIDLRRERVDLTVAAQQSMETVRPWATEKGVRLELDAEGAPKTNGDPRRIAQVLDNLLSNAIKFSSEGGSVTVEVRGNGQWTHVTVADTGIGIPAEEQAHVFSRFYRARAANELAVPGTGLGLAITRALVDQHGGSIGLESVEGAGTRVTVTLPAA
ncbi:MAG: PAS domain-containing protein [Actinobacteria bacterium]|nr:PAS domain-containing protein [Actinomycetota bacterium]